ncbi:hypothetical protein HK101_010380 [Irineochytrium annulatum]|nr:hypothetical protein HK101_010380 [Irineochytrium annulatum]
MTFENARELAPLNSGPPDPPLQFGMRNKTTGFMLTGRSVTLNCIFYGNWSESQIAIVENFFQHLSDHSTSPSLFNVVGSYIDNFGLAPSTHLIYGGRFVDNYSHGTAINTSQPFNSGQVTFGVDYNSQAIAADTFQIVLNSITNGPFKHRDNETIYALMPSPDVTITDGFFGSAYCAFHDGRFHSFDNGKSDSIVTYAFAPNPGTKYLDGCAPNQFASPNGDLGIDSLVNALHHELLESITDPGVNAGPEGEGYDIGLYDFHDQGEVADVCQTYFGDAVQTMNTGNGDALWNVMVGGKPYMVQSAWDLSIQGCVMQRPKASDLWKSPLFRNSSTIFESVCKTYYGPRRWFTGTLSADGSACEFAYTGTTIDNRAINTATGNNDNYRVSASVTSPFFLTLDSSDSPNLSWIEKGGSTPSKGGYVVASKDCKYGYPTGAPPMRVYCMDDFYTCRYTQGNVSYVGDYQKSRGDYCFVSVEGAVVLGTPYDLLYDKSG